MEFKLGSEREALKQIKERQYHESYAGQAKNILLVGVCFDMEKRNIGGYIVEDYKSVT